MESKKENSCKIKEAIDLLSATLVEKEDEKSTSNQPSLSEAIGSCTTSSATSFRQSPRALSACSKALDTLSHLRQMRLAEQKGNFQSYQDDKRNKRSIQVPPLGGTPSKVIKPSPWSHKFVCLATKAACKVPTSAEKGLFSSFGLGEKVIKFPSFQTTMLDEFQDILKREYPQLEFSGGFDLLRCKPNSKELEEISYMATYPLPRIQQNVSSGRVYIRPLQNDIKLDDDDDQIEWVNTCM